jgi:hypothetical protein
MKSTKYAQWMLLSCLSVSHFHSVSSDNNRHIASIQEREKITIEKIEPKPIKLIPVELKEPELAKPMVLKIDEVKTPEAEEAEIAQEEEKSPEQTKDQIQKDFDIYVCKSEEKMNQLNQQIEQLVQQQQTYLNMFMLMTQLMFNYMQIQNQTVTYAPVQFGPQPSNQPYMYPLGEAPLMMNPPTQNPLAAETSPLINSPSVAHHNETIDGLPNMNLGFNGFNFDNTSRPNFDLSAPIPLQILN